MNKCIVYNQKPISRGKNKWHIIIIGIVRRAADRLTEIHGDRRHRREMADRLIRDHGDRHRRGLADRLIRDRGDRRHRREMADRLIRIIGECHRKPGKCQDCVRRGGSVRLKKLRSRRICIWLICRNRGRWRKTGCI